MADPLIVSTAVTLAAIGASVLVGYEAGRTEQIAAGWHEGCAQLARWRAAAARFGPALASALLAAVAAVCSVVSRAAVPSGTGVHRRREVTR